MGARRDDPVCQAIAAETCQPHQIDVLGVMPVLQMPHQSAECGSGDGMGHSIQKDRSASSGG